MRTGRGRLQQVRGVDKGIHNQRPQAGKKPGGGGRRRHLGSSCAAAGTLLCTPRHHSTDPVARGRQRAPTAAARKRRGRPGGLLRCRRLLWAAIICHAPRVPPRAGPLNMPAMAKPVVLHSDPPGSTLLLIDAANTWDADSPRELRFVALGPMRTMASVLLPFLTPDRTHFKLG